MSLADSHVEHYIPQSLYTNLDLEYENLMLSCNGANGQKRNCGHAKGKIDPTDTMISPLTADCSDNFSFTGRGKICPHGDIERAQYTISALNLNSPALSSARTAALWASGVLSEDIDIEKLREIILHPVNGEMLPFSDIILYFLDDQQILKCNI